MKLMIAAVALAAVVPAAAVAQDREVRQERVFIMSGPGGEPTDVPEGGLSREAFLARQGEAFARLDTNGDGVVSREEMRARAPGDGHDFAFNGADGREIRVVRRPGTPGAPEAPGERRVVIRRSGGDAPMIIEGSGLEDLPGGGERQVFVFRSSGENRMDADGDGRLTFEEMAAPLRRHFEQQDANGDGYLDESERAPVPPLPPMAPEPPAPPPPPPAPVY